MAYIISRLILIILALALLPLIIDGITHVTVQGIDAVASWITGLFKPFGMQGRGRLEGVIRLACYLLVILLTIRYFLRKDR